MKYLCLGCGYETDDEVDFLAHLVECESKPESKWGTYLGSIDVTEQPFKNSEILEEGK